MHATALLCCNLCVAREGKPQTADAGTPVRSLPRQCVDSAGGGCRSGLLQSCSWDTGPRWPRDAKPGRWEGAREGGIGAAARRQVGAGAAERSGSRSGPLGWRRRLSLWPVAAEWEDQRSRQSPFANPSGWPDGGWRPSGGIGVGEAAGGGLGIRQA